MLFSILGFEHYQSNSHNELGQTQSLLLKLMYHYKLATAAGLHMVVHTQLYFLTCFFQIACLLQKKKEKDKS